MGTNYHNEVLRKARVLERKRMAGDFYQESPEEEARLQQVIRDIKYSSGEVSMQNSTGNSGISSNRASAVGTDRNRQAYDHSRNGPIRDDSNRMMKREGSSMFGNKPNHMYNVWKG